MVPASLLLGPVVKAVSPVRTLNLLLAKATGGDAATGLTTYPARLGYWPAAAGLFAFTWQELVNPQSAYLSSVRLWLAGYLAIMLIGAAVFGDEWLERADPFEVYSSLLAHLSAWGRNGDRLVVRSPLANLATVTPRPGLVAVVSVLFGSTAFDTYKDTIPWQRFVIDVGLNNIFTNTVALLVFCVIVGGSFTVAAMSTGVETTGPHAVRRRDLPDLLAHSVIPIIVGYMTAHYLSYLIEQGQNTIIQLSDPMVRGDNLLGTANFSVNYWLSFHPSLLATMQVLAVVTGHVCGVIAAHDRAISLLPEATPRERPDRDAGHHGRLHRDRALPADGWRPEQAAARTRRRGPRSAPCAAVTPPARRPTCRRPAPCRSSAGPRAGSAHRWAGRSPRPSRRCRDGSSPASRASG